MIAEENSRRESYATSVKKGFHILVLALGGKD